jgi:hypothetical protein
VRGAREAAPVRFPAEEVIMTAVSAPPREAPYNPAGFRRLWALAASWNGTWRYRPAGADLEAALRQAGSEIGAAFERVEAAAEDARLQVADALRLVEAARRDGPDVLIAVAHGDSIPGLRDEALFTALTLWGENARPEVEGVSDVRTSIGARGRFRACVRVRCLNYAEIERDRDGGCPK